MNADISDEKLAKYFSVTEEALAMARGAINPARHNEALDALDMVERYVSDAHHFKSQDDYVNAFAALNYAHGWLDCGARTGLFDVHDSRLFTVDDAPSENGDRIPERIRRADARIRAGMGVIIMKDGKIFLQRRGPGCRDCHGEWETPGGAVEEGESLFDAAAREVKEETGLSIRITKVIDVTEELGPNHWISFTLLSEVVGGEPRIAEPDKCTAQGFFPLDALPAPIAELSMQGIRSHLAGKETPFFRRTP